MTSLEEAPIYGIYLGPQRFKFGAGYSDFRRYPHISEYTFITFKSSAVAEMGDRFATIDMCRHDMS